MSEYISKQEINRVLLNRIDMNNKCLSGARESEHFEEEKYFSTLIFEDEQIKALLEEPPSADVIEHARAIKEYCKERTKKPTWCNDCPLYEAFCKINTPPNMWDLPIGEKGTE